MVVGGGEPRLDDLVASLGQTWEINTNSSKPFPCGIVCHPAIDAAIQCHQEMVDLHHLSPAEVEKVELRVHPLVVELTAKPKPRDGLEAKFSVFHGCAVGLLYGRAGPSQYADEVVRSGEVIAIRDRVHITPDEALGADEVHLALQHKDGTRLERHILHAVGSMQVPMTDEQLEEKFMDQVSHVLGEQGAEKASVAAWNIGRTEDIATVLRTFQASKT